MESKPIQENSQIDLKWIKDEIKDLTEQLVYFEGLYNRESYLPDANRDLTKDIINNLKMAIKENLEDYVRRTKNKKSK